MRQTAQQLLKSSQVFDAAKTNQVTKGNSHPNHLFCYLYNVDNHKELIGAMKRNPVPNKERCEKAGVSVVLSLDCLSLKSFQIGRGKNKFTVKAPENHLGKVIPPSAWVCVNEAKTYYREKYEQIAAELTNHLTKK